MPIIHTVIRYSDGAVRVIDSDQIILTKKGLYLGQLNDEEAIIINMEHPNLDFITFKVKETNNAHT